MDQEFVEFIRLQVLDDRNTSIQPFSSLIIDGHLDRVAAAFL